MDFTIAIYLLPIFYVIYHFAKLAYQRRNQSCYMLNYECYRPPDDRTLDTEMCAKIVVRNNNLRLEEHKFLLKTIVNSGIGEETYAPKNVIMGREECATLTDCLTEMEDVFFTTMDKIFATSGFSPSDIDILVVNVTLLSAVPSLTSRIINHYKMREDIKSFNISGMGCSASVVAIDVVQHLFKVHKNSLAIVVSTECMSPHWYCGRDKSMMLSNCIFRSGGCSMLFTNNPAFKNRAILKLKTMVRTHTGSVDESYSCCIQEEDDQGYGGFRLTKGLPKAAAHALTKNLTVLLPKVLPLWEIFRYTMVFQFYRIRKRVTGKAGAGRARLNLKTGIDHFCIHPGGRAVIDEVGKSLGLNEYDVEPARMALHRWGNTSAGGLWYVLGYMEAKKRLKKGETILMISLGAGFKCNNCVWEVVRDLEDKNVWKDCIDRYPPKSLANTFMEKYGWINDEEANFVNYEEAKKMINP